MFNLSNKIFVRFFLGLGFILLLNACEGHPRGILSQSDMTDVLTDLHKLDGCLYEKGYQYGHFDDKAPYYNFVLNKHGITEAQFDSSLVWYTKNPKQFEEIYTNVLTQLTDFDNEVKNNKYHPIDSAKLAIMKVNLWKKGIRYNFTKDSVRTKLNFEIIDSTLWFGDVYTLHFLQRIAPEDSCLNQQVVMRINYVNGQKDSARIESHNDSLLRRYTFHMPALRKLKIKSISGELLGSSKFKGTFNASLDSISLIREYNTLKLDSLHKVVLKADSALQIKKSKLKSDTLQKTKVLQKQSPPKKNQKPLRQIEKG